MKISELLDLAPKVFEANDNKIAGSSNNRTNKTVINFSKNLMYMPNIRAIKEPIFLIPNAKKINNYLKQAFIKASIFWYFDLKSYIQIKTHVSSYAINRVLS